MASLRFTCVLLIASVQVFSSDAQCPGALTATSAYQAVVSPGYPMYQRNVNCGFRITTGTANERVNIGIDMDLFDDTCNDKIEVFNGADGTGAVADTFCGKGKAMFQSSGQQIFVRFTTNNAGDGKGFVLKYWSAAAWAHCGPSGVPKVLMAPRNDSMMDFVMDHIPSNTNCKHKIMAASTNEKVGMIVKSTLDNPNSCVMVENAVNRDGNATTYCGMFPAHTFISTGQELSFTVMTDGAITKGKLMIYYYSLHKEQMCKRYENLLATRTKKTLMTPNYPNEYPLDARCSWRFVSYRSDYVVVIEVEESDLPSDCSDMGYVNDGEQEINDRLGEWCGKRKPMYRGTGQTLLLTFDADHMTKGNKGFKFIYYADHAEPREIVAGTDVATIAAVFTIIIVAGGIIFIIYRLCTRNKARRKAREADRQPITQ